MHETLERLRAVLDTHGLARVSGDILDATRPGVGFDLTPGEGPLGSTRFGGSPDLPRGFKWPVRDNVNAFFVAQINLAEVSGLLTELNPLPKDGLLSFFWWQAIEVGSDADGCCVHLFRREGLQRQTDPWSLQPEKIGFLRRLFGAKPSELGMGWRGCHAASRLGWWLNHLALETGLSARLTPEEHDQLFGGLDEQLAKAGMPNDGHHILGCAQPVQGAVEVEAELEPGASGGEAWSAAAAKAAHWRCLLEVVSDGGPNFCFGDWGRLYFMMKEQDLAAGRFERVQIVTQCH